nr:helix-turn-helix domain-containing protein [Agrobacterium leguminum]
MEAALNLINGRWKGVILYHLMTDGTTRFNALQRLLPGCAFHLLTKQLRELEEDGFVHRQVYLGPVDKVDSQIS